jgi:hypothetical protein
MHNGYGKWCYSQDINLGMYIKKHDHNSHGFQAKNQMDKSKYTQLTKMLLTKVVYVPILPSTIPTPTLVETSIFLAINYLLISVFCSIF